MSVLWKCYFVCKILSTKEKFTKQPIQFQVFRILVQLNNGTIVASKRLSNFRKGSQYCNWLFFSSWFCLTAWLYHLYWNRQEFLPTTMAAVGWGQAPTALRLGWTRVGRNRLIYYLHFPYYIKGFIYRPDYNCPLHKLSNLLNLTNPIYWKYLLSNRIFELNLNLPILSPICALGRTRHDDLDHTSSWSWPELVPIKSGHLPRTLHTLPRFVVPRRHHEHSPPCRSGARQEGCRGHITAWAGFPWALRGRTCCRCTRSQRLIAGHAPEVRHDLVDHLRLAVRLGM